MGTAIMEGMCLQCLQPSAVGGACCSQPEGVVLSLVAAAMLDVLC